MSELSSSEWEQICDGCGLCCLEKLIDDETGKIYFTRVACKYFDIDSCRCLVYGERSEKNEDCMDLSLYNINEIENILPESCSYLYFFRYGRLPSWHYLESEDKNLVHKKGISAKKIAVSGENIHPDDLEFFII